MYNRSAINRLVAYIEGLNGIGDKNRLAEAVKDEFDLIQDRKVYYCEDFAIRFSKSESRRMSNTVLSLSALQKYDDIPFVVCIVSSRTNYLLLANSTFLKKISQTPASQLIYLSKCWSTCALNSRSRRTGRLPTRSVKNSANRESQSKTAKRAPSGIGTPDERVDLRTKPGL